MSEFQKFTITFVKMNFDPKMYETTPLFENNSSGPINFNILRYSSSNQIPFYSWVPVILHFLADFSSGIMEYLHQHLIVIIIEVFSVFQWQKNVTLHLWYVKSFGAKAQSVPAQGSGTSERCTLSRMLHSVAQLVRHVSP